MLNISGESCYETSYTVEIYEPTFTGTVQEVSEICWCCVPFVDSSSYDDLTPFLPVMLELYPMSYVFLVLDN